MDTLSTSEQLKQLVKEKYGQVADQSREDNAASCCGSGCGCGTIDQAIMAEDYTALPGYVADADLGLGCGLPTEFAKIKEGDVVIDLGSGAGNDAFVARSIAGASGKVIGIDFTEKMISKARLNAEKLGFHNVEFRYGDIEKIPVSQDVADVVVSNCVLNLVPDKAQAFAETLRVLKVSSRKACGKALKCMPAVFRAPSKKTTIFRSLKKQVLKISSFRKNAGSLFRMKFYLFIWVTLSWKNTPQVSWAFTA
jgi:SAM-dependent methyltransferase